MQIPFCPSLNWSNEGLLLNFDQLIDFWMKSLKGCRTPFGTSNVEMEVLEPYNTFLKDLIPMMQFIHFIM